MTLNPSEQETIVKERDKELFRDRVKDNSLGQFVQKIIIISIRNSQFP